MHPDSVNRRDFHKLSAAALGGLIAGVAFGCGEDASKSVGKLDLKPKGEGPGKVTPVSTGPPQHACRGLNECKGQGRDHKNACAGQGSCYTVTHDCSGKNDCKYQGGCGGQNGANDCQGKGGCGHFPIAEEDVWKKARESYEGRMKKLGKTVGKAPAPAKA
jgi:hypothetical protein